MDGAKYSVLCELLQTRIHDEVHMENYKHGAFKDQITLSTDVFNAIKILTDSPLTTEPEKAKFWETGRMISVFKSLQANIAHMNRMHTLGAVCWIEHLFDDDQVKRDVYVPPLVAHMFDGDGNLTKTQTCDIYGNVTTTSKGADRTAHAAAAARLANRKKTKGEKAWPTTHGALEPQYSSRSYRADSSADPAASISSPSSTSQAADTKKSTDDEDRSFGRTFNRNLRRASN